MDDAFNTLCKSVLVFHSEFGPWNEPVFVSFLCSFEVWVVLNFSRISYEVCVVLCTCVSFCGTSLFRKTKRWIAFGSARTILTQRYCIIIVLHLMTAQGVYMFIPARRGSVGCCTTSAQNELHVHGSCYYFASYVVLRASF